MKNLLKILSILEIIVGVLGIIVGIMTLALGGLMNGAIETAAQQNEQIALNVSCILRMLSSGFFLLCGIYGLKGSNGNQKSLAAAIKLGWVGLAAAILSGVLTLFGDATADRIITAISSSVVPVLFLVSAKNTK